MPVPAAPVPDQPSKPASPGDEAAAGGAVAGDGAVIAVPRASGQPICAVVGEEHGVARVRAFARRWRTFLYYRDRLALGPHDLCAATCTGLTSRCHRLMEREGFLRAIRPPAA